MARHIAIVACVIGAVIGYVVVTQRAAPSATPLSSQIAQQEDVRFWLITLRDDLQPCINDYAALYKRPAAGRTPVLDVSMATNTVVDCDFAATDLDQISAGIGAVSGTDPMLRGALRASYDFVRAIDGVAHNLSDAATSGAAIHTDSAELTLAYAGQRLNELNGILASVDAGSNL